MAKFFISYRRTDTAQIVGRVYDKLATYFGADAIFVDVDDIPPGTNFRTHIQGFISTCDALLVVIGPHWVDRFAHEEVLGDSEDYVRIEIEIALGHAIPVLPILIDQTPMPRHTELPSTISQFAMRNAFQLDIGRDFNTHVNHLISHLESIRITKILDSQQIIDYRIIEQACNAIRIFLSDEYNASLPSGELYPRIEFHVYGSYDFQRPMEAGISLFLHRIVQDSTSLIEIHFILTAWGKTASLQHVLIGWMIDRIRRNPILPGEVVQNSGLSAIPPGVTLRIFPSMEDARTIWSSITQAPYQISVSYILRASY
jgi:TIR domain/Pvc16 N-terminal domain